MPTSATAPNPTTVRRAWWAVAFLAVAVVVYLMATADTGPADPTEAGASQARATVVANSAIIVFREGLEAVLIFAAVTASFLGANRARRRPVVAGAALAFAASVATWFIVLAALSAASSLGPRLEAITGFVAIVVLLIVLNWSVHRVYWSEWIGRHHRRRRALPAQSGVAATAGLVALGFTSPLPRGLRGGAVPAVLRLEAGTDTVLEGVALSLAGT